uniref:Kelch-like protein 9 n=1 Tax=Phallusia mammillata TaxID=59560 RepID=A0A6F9DGQ6_9ASCI|nr:kelch-like protein 9 [Phallusia mammillata]
MVLFGSNQDQQKCNHASYLFNEMSKFQKVGILCDVKVPGQLHVVKAHKIVLMSANPKSDTSGCKGAENQTAICDFPVEEVLKAYAPNNTAEDPPGPEAVVDSLGQRLGALNDLRLHHCCCDVTLVANEMQCDVHKVVLAACSDYFRAMFTSKMKESMDNRVVLHNVDSFYVRTIIDFMYTGEITLDFNGACDLLEIAVFYQILPLINRCQTYLISNLSAQNCCYLTMMAHDLALDDFLSHCRSYAFEHFLELDHDDSEVDLLLADDLVACLSRNDLGNGISNTSTEQTVLRVVLRWLRRKCDDVEIPEQDRILSQVRFSLIAKQDIDICCRALAMDVDNNNNNNNGDDFFASFGPAFKKHYERAVTYHNRVFEQPLLHDRSDLRTDQYHRACVDGVLAPNPVKLPSYSKNVFVGVQDVNPDSEGNVPIRDPYHNVVDFNGFLYLLGSTRTRDSCYSRTVTRYDPRLDSTIAIASMGEERGDFVACVLNDYIYVIGGRNRHGALASCERYDPRQNSWEKIADLPQGIYMAAGLAHDGCIYVTGGFNDYETTGTTLRYHVTDDTWEEIFAPMMCDRGFHALVKGHDGLLWAVGGVDNPFSGRNVWEVEAFDPDLEMWRFVGQVLPVQPFLSMMRINVFLERDNRTCVFPVSTPHKYPMLEHVPRSRMWFEMRSRVVVSQVQVD